MLPALAGPLVTVSMLDRVIVVMRRDADRLTKALQDGGIEGADLVLWHQMLDACQVPGAVLTVTC